MTEQTIRQRLADAGRSFYLRNLAGGSSGNLSARLPDGGYVATPTGISLGEIDPASLSRLDAFGAHIDGLKPTKEVFVHLACYAAREECGAIVHLHSPYATAVSCLNGLNGDDVVPAITPYGLMRYGRIGLVPYCKPGSAQLRDAVMAQAAKHAALLLANHGLLATGRDIGAAASNADEMEDACRLLILLRGQDVRYLTESEQMELLTH